MGNGSCINNCLSKLEKKTKDDYGTHIQIIGVMSDEQLDEQLQPNTTTTII